MVLFDKKVFEKKYIEPGKRVPVDTLFLIGNGFDIWQGLNTRYAAFEEYYKTHIDEVLAKLHLPMRQAMDDDGSPRLDAAGNAVTYCDVELFYGDPSRPRHLPSDFWRDFETSLDKIDDQEINFFFGRTREGIRAIRTCAANAQRIMREVFSDWVLSIDIDAREPQYDFGDGCLFVNFNYTDTLQKRFGVKPENEYHIHGSADDRASIVFGHSTHPEKAFPSLNMGPAHPRFMGLYYIEEFLYNADKHVEDRFHLLRAFLALHGVRLEDIKRVYVLGLGYGAADLGYIKHLVQATEGITEDPESDLTEGERRYLDAMDNIALANLNIQYAISHRERMLKKAPINYPEYEALDAVIHSMLEDPYYHISREDQMRLETAAVRRRFWKEQEERDRKIDKEFLRFIRKREKRSFVSLSDAFMEADEEAKRALTGAEWHISYVSEGTKNRIEAAMAAYGCKNYHLHHTIEDCIESFRLRPSDAR